jgi:tetratricopeptide (TPR) repeat protein
MKKIVILLVSLIAIISLPGCSSPEEKAAAHMANADAFMAENEPEKARIEFRNALQLNQNLPEAWYGLASIHEQRREWRKAYNILTRIRESNPRYMNGRILLANILLAANRIDEALEDARDIVGLMPDDARAHAIMAAVRFRLDNLEAAWQSVDKALSLDAKSEDAILVKIRILKTERKFQDALVILDKILAVSPQHSSYYVMKLGIYEELGDQSAVLQTYAEMVRQFPDNVTFKRSLVRYQIQAGNLDQAELLLMSSVEKDPTSVEEKLRLVRFFIRHRERSESIALLDTYINQNPDEYQFKFVLAELYLRENQAEQAIGIYEGIVRDDKLQPNGLKARNVLARINLLAGRLVESKFLIDEVLAHDKNNEGALLVLARLNLAGGKRDDAVTSLRTVLRDNPNSIEALTLLGRAQAEQGNVNIAIESLNKAFEMNPSSADVAGQLASTLMRTGQPEQADEILWRSIEAGNGSVEALKLLIQINLMLGKWEQAEQLAQRLKSIEGEEALAQQALGLAYYGKDQQDESILAFRRAHELEPRVPKPLVALVKSYVEANQPDKARDFLQSVVADNPENSTAYHLLGQLSLRDKDVEAAIGYFEMVVELSPGSEIGYLSLGSIYLREGQLLKAEAIFTSGVKAVPASLTLSINQALVVEKQGKIDRAIELYEKILEANPDVMIAKNNLASLLTDYRDDKASHERARELAAEFRDAKIPLFRDTYAWVSVKLDLYLEEAIAIFKSIIREDEDVGLYHYHLGEAYRKNGNSFDARKHLRRAIELENPESPIATDARKALDLVS